MQRWVRTFIAIEATGSIAGRAVRLIDKLREVPAHVRWVEPPFHFTLKFLGDVESLEIPEVCDRVAEAVADIPPFDLEVRGAGAFPVDDRPRTVWIGTGAGTTEMVDVHDQIDKALAEVGFRSEGRRFRPHLTIGRVRRSPEAILPLGEAVRAEADYDCGSMRVDEILIFSSHLSRSGPVYEVLGRAELL